MFAAEQREIEGRLTRLEGQVDALRRMYDQYFQGVERLPPEQERVRLKREIDRLVSANIRNTALRFRAQGLQSRFLSFERRWLRVMQQIEDGTYRPHVKRAEYRARVRAGEQAPQQQAAARRPAGLGNAGIDDDRVRQIHANYVEARRRTGESTGIQLDSLKKSIEKQIPTIQQKFGTEQVDFKVVIRKGKAMLKPVVRES